MTKLQSNKKDSRDQETVPQSPVLQRVMGGDIISQRVRDYIEKKLNQND